MASKMHQVKHNETVLRELEVGDLIEFPRGYYSHWGVYVGEEEVVHLAGEGDGNDGINDHLDSGHLFTVCGRHFNKACAKVDNFWDVAGQSRVLKNNAKDKKHPPFPPEKIKQRAFSKLGAIPYNIIWSNCEHFAAWCRNGENKSQQVETVLTWVMGVGTAVIAGGLAIAGYNSTKTKDKEKPEKA